jgi:hypothetical protein
MQANEINARMQRLYTLVLQFDELFRRTRDQAHAWEQEPAEHKREISITLFSAVMGVVETYQQIAGAGL